MGFVDAEMVSYLKLMTSLFVVSPLLLQDVEYQRQLEKKFDKILAENQINNLSQIIQRALFKYLVIPQSFGYSLNKEVYYSIWPQKMPRHHCRMHRTRSLYQRDWLLRSIFPNRKFPLDDRSLRFHCFLSTPLPGNIENFNSILLLFVQLIFFKF